ncbi:unnamed protein product [Heligmosomoides polygyrus]|uniref:DDE-1 domain-containing protein n=1 Tax=Heligmosomoides polygyrus TaxID=6339 RepID=A0A183FLA1_HELPZ|nr:unnamed protein product [Heligmosomoides polygyrus]
MKQSLSSLTHSCTAVPVLYADGRLGDKLFLIFQEASGSFPQCGHWSAPNLLIVAGTSHIMMKQQVPRFFREYVIGSSAAPLSIVLLDSWHGLRDHENLVSEVPAGKELKLMTIPPGATSLCQPLDVYFFRLFKRFIRRIHEHVLHFRPDFNCSREYFEGNHESLRTSSLDV